MKNDFYPQARSENLVIQTLPDETLVYDLTTHKAHCLNETSSFIWDRCNGELSVDKILKVFEDRFGQPVERELIELALTLLYERHLLTNDFNTAVQVPNRRELIKQIGLASVVAIPVVATLLAPQSAFAIAGNCTCASPAQCRQSACPSTTNCNPLGLCAA